MDSSSKNLWPVNAIFFLRCLLFLMMLLHQEIGGKKNLVQITQDIITQLEVSRRMKKNGTCQSCRVSFLSGPGDFDDVVFLLSSSSTSVVAGLLLL